MESVVRLAFFFSSSFFFYLWFDDLCFGLTYAFQWALNISRLTNCSTFPHQATGSRLGQAVRRYAGKRQDLSSIPLRISFLVKGCGLWTLPCDCALTISETLKCPTSLPIVMQGSFWCWQCSDRYIISTFPYLHTPTPFSPSLISLTVSVDVKHHVYWSCRWWQYSVRCNLPHHLLGYWSPSVPSYWSFRWWQYSVRCNLPHHLLGCWSPSVPSQRQLGVEHVYPTIKRQVKVCASVYRAGHYVESGKKGWWRLEWSLM